MKVPQVPLAAVAILAVILVLILIAVLVLILVLVVILVAVLILILILVIHKFLPPKIFLTAVPLFQYTRIFTLYPWL